MDEGSRGRSLGKECEPEPTAQYQDSTAADTTVEPVPPLPNQVDTSGLVRSTRTFGLPPFNYAFGRSPSPPHSSRRPSLAPIITRSCLPDQPERVHETSHGLSSHKRRRLYAYEGEYEQDHLVRNDSTTPSGIAAGLLSRPPACVSIEQEELEPTLQGPGRRDRSYHVTNDPARCLSSCAGHERIRTQNLIQQILSESYILDARTQDALTSGALPLAPVPDVAQSDPELALHCVLELVRRSSARLTGLARSLNVCSDAHLKVVRDVQLGCESSDVMQRQQALEGRGGQDQFRRPPSNTPFEASQHTDVSVTPSVASDESSRHQHTTVKPLPPYSPRLTTSSSDSGPLRSQTPLQAQSSRILPSPTSLNFPISSTLPSITSPNTPLHTSTRAAHLQDLQHQVSVKTLALQTLQREYDSLLQKLERQRLKCAALEKKFDVTDAEINSLTDDKEKLQTQVTALETQVEELQRSRDEARRELVANGAQYVKIMEMASRLQAQGAEDKRRWAAEKEKLEGRVKVLEGGQHLLSAGGTAKGAGEGPTGEVARPAVLQAAGILQDTAMEGAGPIEGAVTMEAVLLADAAATTAALRNEVVGLKRRNMSLEAALKHLREESRSMEEAAHRVQSAIDEALEA